MKLKKPLDALDVRLLTLLHDAGADYFLIGAMARELVLHHVYEQPSGSATDDMDFAIAVVDWEEFNAIRQRLLAYHPAIEPGAVQHRLYMVVDAPADMPGAPPYKRPFDIIPFKGVADAQQQLHWPPDFQVHMNIAGYTEVHADSLEIEIHPGLTVKAASLPGIAILKLLAWNDRWSETPRDAHDLLTVMQQYGATQNLGRLYEDEYIGQTEVYGWDIDKAWIGMLGHDMRLIANLETLQQLLALLDNPDSRQRLVIHVGSKLKDDERADEMLSILQAGLTPDASA